MILTNSLLKRINKLNDEAEKEYSNNKAISKAAAAIALIEVTEALSDTLDEDKVVEIMANAITEIIKDAAKHTRDQAL